MYLANTRFVFEDFTMHGCARPHQLTAEFAIAAVHIGELAVNGALTGSSRIKNPANKPAGIAFVPSSTTHDLQVVHGHAASGARSTHVLKRDLP
jgi:hypothetical protein